MIPKQDLRDMAAIAGVHAHVVEKDYALGWALAGIFSQPELAGSWIFKGGTCIRKCYFETHRFSEDLDFTLRDAAQMDEGFLRGALEKMSAWIHARTKLRFPIDSQSARLHRNPRGSISGQCRIGYAGPMAPRSGGLPRIKIDLNADECLVLPLAEIPIRHPYSDAPGTGARIRAYAFEEVYAEKIRALAERTHPRDLYDVVNVFRNARKRPSVTVVRDVLEQKCSFRKVAVPQLSDLDRRRSRLEDLWDAMLVRQLPALPPVDAVWDGLDEFFSWLESGQLPPRLRPIPLAHGDTVVRERTLDLRLSRREKSHLEIIRFSTANRLCADLEYDDVMQRVEPYSLRQTPQGDFVVHAWSVGQGACRGYRLDRIQSAQMATQSFSPRHEIELTPEDSAAGPGKQP